MSFQPVLPLTGTAGWAFLKRTEAAQAAAFQRQPALQRDETYFREKIGTVREASALVDDRRLLRITLEAFGLEADVNARAFLRQVLEQGTARPEALANRLADPRYREFSQAFGFGTTGGPRTNAAGFADQIVSRWKERRFEAAIGQQDNSLRLALNARRELAALARGSGTEDAKWFRIMGNTPLRTVVQGALGLPQSFVSVDLDRQLGILKARAESVLGSGKVSQFSDPARVDAVVRRYLAQSAEVSRTGPGAAALTILQSGGWMRRL